MFRRAKRSCSCPLLPTCPCLTPTHLPLAERNAAVERRRKSQRARKVSANAKRKSLLRKPVPARLKCRLVMNSTLLGSVRNVTKLSAPKTLKRNLFIAKESVIVPFIILVPSCLASLRQKRYGYAKIVKKGVINVESARSAEPTTKMSFVVISKIVDSFSTNLA